MQINAFVRYNIGKKANKNLRNNDIIPAIIYGDKKQNVLIGLEKKIILNFIKQETFSSTILYIKLFNKKEKVILRDIQRHPYKNLINHIDLLRINENKQITVLVKIKLIGKELCKGVKQDGGLLVLHKSYVRIKCLPKFLPKAFEINVSNLSVGQSVDIKQFYKTNNFFFIEKTNKIVTVKHVTN
ncbi:50S ribosomal protein L25 [Candidatus Portiera aleyrodidarum]|uniref:Large ribosomal subunit protein bL25 n=2 Tax=Candidatus Portiera aleyrodidarum TaxID=91844 RepID=A0AAU8S7K0_9GAMM|nr:50S ribosomal protein L25 [Candidatus Portiera aleyrodidarum]AFS18954.1 50S ribosomal protein L25 [Candidatus Portiera aleyrodidarum BT-QVLC]AFQ24197.1 LSU ribosomal protein L25P [Candidatus Portiera aleyrodidarum BT-B-HRs]AFT80609.1 LSU ribosomal protein L25p [Candidatus Portiera aleyrodidarum BT-QVLC]AFT80886.1 LSU ribosomal protein L25p [Candidatus Portiera aleyrodidarum BT-B-HRs]AJF24175.1 50S ribosomal protein L25 [Candidatus Portiera aleyrodidarum MED (Bemisia tabaci)]